MDKKEIIKLIEKAKIRVENKYEGHILKGERSKRNWLKTHVDSYEGKSNRVTFLVLEGSPPKGYVIINPGHGLILALDCQLNKLHTYRTYQAFYGIEGIGESERGQARADNEGGESDST